MSPDEKYAVGLLLIKREDAVLLKKVLVKIGQNAAPKGKVQCSFYNYPAKLDAPQKLDSPRDKPPVTLDGNSENDGSAGFQALNNFPPEPILNFIVYGLEEADRNDQFFREHTVVMSQYRSLYKDEFSRRYIDSGLRRLRSEESRLYLDRLPPKSKNVVDSEDSKVRPLLREISSELFEVLRGDSRIEEHVKDEGRVPEYDEVELSKDLSEISSLNNEDVVLDVTPLTKLQELINVTYTIDIPLPYKKTDFCVHTRDADNDSLLSVFENLEQVEPRNDFCLHNREISNDTLSINSDDEKRINETDAPRFFRRDDFCVHNTDFQETSWRSMINSRT